MRIFVLTMTLVFGLPIITQAASLYLDPPFADIYRSDAIITSVRLDVDKEIGECINVFDIVINYTEPLIPVDVSLGQSFVPLWIQAPVIDTTNRTISMLGGIPNGYCGRVAGDSNLTNVLADIIFRLPGNEVVDVDTALISFSPNTSVLLNDGRGTTASLRTFRAEYRLYDEAGEEIRDEWTAIINADTIPPEPFEVTLHKGDLATNGKYFIEFNTTDKQSGLSHYEVMEERDFKNNFFSFGAANAPWTRERSPYVLDDQSLRSIIRVKAIDKAGNERIATLLPQNTGLQLFEIVMLSIGFVAVLTLGLLSWFLYRRRNVQVNANSFNQHYE